MNERVTFAVSLENNISTLCTCGCDNGIVVKIFCEDDDDYAFISTVANCFYSKQDGILRTIARRMKAAWFMLCGKEFRLHEVALSKKDWVKFVEAVNNVGKETD